MISETDILLRLVIAAALGTLVGLERERHDQPAGLRTHMILVVGATLAMCLSINLATGWAGDAPNGDPARLAAQVVSGIGFLGAGAILRYGTSVKGLTTAASLWTMAVVGLSVGAGHFLSAAAATGLLLIILSIINRVEKRSIASYGEMHVILLASDRPDLVEHVRERLKLRRRQVYSFSMEKDIDAGTVELDFLVKLKAGNSIEDLVEEIAGVEGVRRVKIWE